MRKPFFVSVPFTEICVNRQFFLKLFRSLASFSSIVGVIALCVAVAAGFVWPLWFWATVSSNSYTLCVVVIICVLLSWQIIKLAKKSSVRKVAITLAKIIVAASCIFAAGFLVLQGKRFFAIPVVIAGIILEAVIGAVGKKKETFTVASSQ